MDRKIEKVSKEKLDELREYVDGKLIALKVAASIAGISYREMKKCGKNGEFPIVDIGGVKHVRETDFKNWLNS